MEIYDGHVHIRNGEINQIELKKSLGKIGVSGAVLISMPPSEKTHSDRLANLMEWCRDAEELIPFFWVDPMEPGAVEQVKKAVSMGVKGFKIICDRFYPSDRRCLAVCKVAADADKPVMFHSGILWDGKASSEYNRPVNFECLLGIEGLRFSLAHIGWPWCDEMVAVFGKFLNFKSTNPKSGIEMYIDLTPGTPMNYRDDAIKKLFGTGYDVNKNLIFGSDCNALGYNIKWTGEWIDIDNGIYSRLGLEDEVIEDIYKGNLLTFISGSGKRRSYRDLIPASL